jgi:hypothetical protein
MNKTWQSTFLIVTFGVFLGLFAYPSLAQEDADSSPPITSDNVRQLQPIRQLDYADTAMTQDFRTGWFVMDGMGDSFAVPSLLNDGGMRLALWAGQAWQSWDTPDDIATISINTALNRLWFATQQGENVSVYEADMMPDGDLQPTLQATFTTTGIPIDMWHDVSDTGDATLGLEIAQGAGSEIVQIMDDDVQESPYIPDADETAVVRIGRIPLPYVVTSSLVGDVTLWDVARQEQVFSVSNGLDVPSVFGNINTPTTHLVWRDNANESLYLLDFATGENQKIADLNGDYAQWYFLTPDADIILAVNLGFRPHVFAWIVATGERIDLGAYRPCERPQPDMAYLSADGTTLVIGCDAGLEQWRIVLD